MSIEYSFFLGCIMPNRYPAIESATRFVLKTLNMGVKEMERAGCCPAPGVFRSFNKPDWMVAAARNLAIAEQNEADLLTVCSGCFGTLFDVNHVLSNDKELKKKVNLQLKKLGYEVKADQQVKHIAQVLGFDIGPSDIGNYIKRKVKLKVAVHYGCHFLRPFNEKQIDDPDDPSILEDYLEALGVESIDYRRKYACCGAGGGVKAAHADQSMKMLGEKMQAIVESGVDAILDICPFCHLQFDGGQKILNKEYGTDFQVPVIHLSQLTAFCMGMDDIGMKYQTIRPDFKLEAAPLD
ncbi:MAG: CoB--CoM heterodisulfide reductase subunit B [Candidatus Thorarchaeota archaeon]